MQTPDRQLLSGNEAIALGALHAGVTLGIGYPGTPSTEILENLAALGGRAEWAPNEKVAAEVALGVAFARGRTLVTMKHVGLNVAADVLYTIAYSGVQGGYVLVSADDPGMASSQNEQDSRRHALAAGVPCLEPGDSQDAYELTRLAFEISERWEIPVMLRVTTRVCHSHSIVVAGAPEAQPSASYEKQAKRRVMIPAHARPAHHELRRKLREIAAWNESDAAPNRVVPGHASLGIITAGVSFQHVREAAPEASVLKLGLTHPLPMQRILDFVRAHERCVVVEENDPYLVEQIRAAGGDVPRNPEVFRFGELDVVRVRKLIAGDDTPEPPPPRGKPPQLCQGCPHRAAFIVLKEKNLIVAGDIGCYTLAVLPPLEAMDTQLCMGASIGVGLGLRHTLPEAEARRVVSVIGDSTFMHSGLPGIAEMVYNAPVTGHVVIVLDNGTTAMTGLQEHPGTGRTLGHGRAGRVVIEDVCRAMGVDRVHVIDPVRDSVEFARLLDEALASNDLTVFVARQPCILASAKIRQYEKAIEEAAACGCDGGCGCADTEAEEKSPVAGRGEAGPQSPTAAAAKTRAIPTP
jgi:indolepyruvate ferredoxin oxidoreductase, alpha subunit